MGAENSSVADVNSEVIWEDGSCFLHAAKLVDGSNVSAFTYEQVQQNTFFVNNSVKYLRVLRHPSILHFHELIEGSEGRLIITEDVQPLPVVLTRLTAHEIVAGLHEVLQALSFMHQKGSLCHNNVCPSSIFVTPSGEWRLGGLGYTCSYDQATADYLKKHKNMRNQQALAPEEKSGTYKPPIDLKFGYARDAYAFGVLVDTISEQLSELGAVFDAFSEVVQDQLLCEDPVERTSLDQLLTHQLFENDFISILSFLKEIVLKDDNEKRDFFLSLSERLHGLPPELVARRLTKLLLARFVLLDHTAVQHFVPDLLAPYPDNKGRRPFSIGEQNPLISVTLFTSHVIPEIVRIIHVRDLHIRKVLLASFSDYVHYIDLATLRNTVLPQVLLGLRDTDDELVALTLQAVSCLVRIIGGDSVIGPNRSQVFKEGMPKYKKHKMSLRESRKSSVKDTVKSLPNSITSKSQSTIEKDELRKQRREEAHKRAEARKAKREERKLQQQQNAQNTILSEDQENFSEMMSSDNPDYTKSNGHCITDPSNSTSDVHIVQSSSTGVHRVQAAGTRSGSGTDYEEEIEAQLKAMELCDTSATSAVVNSATVNNVGDDNGNNSDSDWGDNWGDDVDTTDDKDNGLGDTSLSHTSNLLQDTLLRTHTVSNTPSVPTPQAATKPQRATTTNANTPLGQEFDVKVEVSASDEMDFFADMEPVIKSATSVLLNDVSPAPAHTPTAHSSTVASHHQSNTTQDVGKTTQSALSMKYVTAEVEVEGEGWNDGDEGEGWGWEEEDGEATDLDHTVNT